MGDPAVEKKVGKLGNLEDKKLWIQNFNRDECLWIEKNQRANDVQRSTLLCFLLFVFNEKITDFKNMAGSPRKCGSNLHESISFSSNSSSLVSLEPPPRAARITISEKKRLVV